MSAVAALGVSGVLAGSAKAQVPVPVDFESAALDLGPAIKGTDVLPNPATLGVTADFAAVPGAGANPFTLAAGDAGFNFPVWSATAVGQNITVDLVLTAPATGTYNGTTGVMSTDPALFNLVMTTQSVGPPIGPLNTCTMPVTLGFNTDNAGAPIASMMGQAFSPALPLGDGAVVALWSDLPVPTPDPGPPVSDCTLVNGLVHGVGGIWFGNGGVTTPGRVAPAAPVVVSVTPTSPANNNSPTVSGTSEAGTTVQLHKNAACTDPIGSGSAAVFGSPGISAIVPDNSTTTIYAMASASGQDSACSATSVTYTEDSIPPASPVITTTNPPSPANNNAPSVIGTAEGGSTVSLYKNGSCSGAPAESGSASLFGTSGISSTVADDTTTTFTADAEDQAGNVSSCSNSLAYTEVSTPPTNPAPTTSPRPTGQRDAALKKCKKKPKKKRKKCRKKAAKLPV